MRGKFSSGDKPVLSGVPKAFAGERQLDGTPTTHFTPPVGRSVGGRGPRPLQDRQAVPDRASDSGMERAMHAHADREHRPTRSR